MFCRKRKQIHHENSYVCFSSFSYRKIKFQQALLIDPENTQALLLRAIALGKLKSISECAVTYREATRINIYFYEAYKGLVETLLSLSHTKDAIQVATTAIKLLGSNHRTLAVLCFY